MTARELADTLYRMYDCAIDGESTSMILLFGVKYAGEIRDCGVSVTEIVRLSGLSSSYATEVYKGMKLSRYVSPHGNA